jgi:cysteinyl-tRNA synthetase
VPDVLAKGYTGRELRYALLRVHYRVPLNFTWNGMEEARQALARIDEWLGRLEEKSQEANVPRSTSNVQRPTQKFEEALDDDLNISAALGFLFETIRETNRAMDRNELDAASAKVWLDWWKRINNVLDLEMETEAAVPAEVAQLAKDRENARREKKWQQSDELRERISALGWEVRDTKDGQKLTPRAASG